MNTIALRSQPEATVASRVASTLRNESTLARLALGAVALHVVDDNFLQPQPGTSAGDHLVSGLVPIAVLAVAAGAAAGECGRKVAATPRWIYSVMLTLKFG
jgi:hypothetical protein